MSEVSLDKEVELLRSIVSGLISSVESSGYVVLSHGGRALQYHPDKVEAIKRAKEMYLG